MRLSTRSRYGVRLMLNLAINAGKGPIFLREIAAREDISEKYLSQIIIPLKGAGLVNTFRGAHGGYILSRDASQINLKDIVMVLEGDLALVDCVTNADICNRSTECVTRDVWSEMSRGLNEYLETVTLESLVKRYNARQDGCRAYADYSI